MWRSRNSAAALVGLWLAAVPVVHAQVPAGTGSPSPNGRTDITAQKITMRNQENKAVFEGNVVLKKGVLIVHSDVMVVFLKANDPKAAQTPAKPSRAGSEELPTVSNRTVNMIEATGKVVRIEKGEGRATCRKATYYEEGRKIVLEGAPVAWQKGTCVSGKRITMFLDDDRTIVEGKSHVTLDQVENAQHDDCSKSEGR